MMKTSYPDWMTDLISCDCDLSMCPMCDSDFYFDKAREDEMCFMPDDAQPPF